MEPGLKVSAGSFDFNQDFDAGGFDATVFPMFGTKQPLILRSKSPAVGPDNPQWTVDIILISYPILGNSVGDLAVGSLGFQGSGVLARAVS